MPNKTKSKGSTTHKNMRTVNRPKSGKVTAQGTKAGKHRQRLPIGHPDRTHDLRPSSR